MRRPFVGVIEDVLVHAYLLFTLVVKITKVCLGCSFLLSRLVKVMKLWVMKRCDYSRHAGDDEPFFDTRVCPFFYQAIQSELGLLSRFVGFFSIPS